MEFFGYGMLSGLDDVFSVGELHVGPVVSCKGGDGKVLEFENDGYIPGCVGWDEEVGSAGLGGDVCCGAKGGVDLRLLCISVGSIGAGMKVFGYGMLLGLDNVISIYEFSVGVVIGRNGGGGGCGRRLLGYENDEGYVIGCVERDEEVGSADFGGDVCCGGDGAVLFRIILDSGGIEFSAVSSIFALGDTASLVACIASVEVG